MRRLIRALDRRLRERLDLFDLVPGDPRCLFRVRIVSARRRLGAGDLAIPEGSPVVELHLLNEHLPAIPAAGPNVAWAVAGRRLLVHTCRELARALREDPRFVEVEAIVGSTVLFAAGDRSGAERLAERLGFLTLDERTSPLRELVENLHAWMIMWAFNAASLRHHRLLAMRRTVVWAPAAEFARLHARSGPVVAA